MPYKHLFFDLDHTLWDFENNARLCLLELFEYFGLKEKGIPGFQAFHETYFKHNEILWDRYRKGYITRKELGFKRMWRVLLDYKIPDTDMSYAMNDRYMASLPQEKQLMSGAIDILDYLKEKGYLIHIITNGPQKGQLQKMRSSGIASYFDVVVTSESTGKPKPHPEIFRFALEKVHAAPEETLMIGDALEVDILGAQQMQMNTVYYNPKKIASSGVVATYEISHLLELKDIL